MDPSKRGGTTLLVRFGTLTPMAADVPDPIVFLSQTAQAMFVLLGRSVVWS